MTDKGFDEYSFYGENNPPVGERGPQLVMSLDDKSDGFSLTFIEEEHLPDGNVKLTFDVGDKAMHHASEAGLKLFLYMGALNITEEQAFTAIWETYKEGPLYVGETDGE